MTPQPPADPDYTAAQKHLARRCAVLKRLIAKHGPCRLRPEPEDPLTMLVRCVISQQVSTKAAITIRKRLQDRAGAFTPTQLTQLTDDDYRGCGLSAAKTRAIRAIVARMQEEPTFLPSLAGRDDEDLRAAITSIKGLGPWSADMLLMFGFGRQDILPVGDLVIQVAMQHHWSLEERPKAPQMLEIAEPWRPYRTIASWYLWRSRDDSDDW
jgi:DNA-3-methyladenine glycosylase II